MAVAAFLGASRIDSGDTVVLHFRLPGEEALAVLVPRHAAGALREGLVQELAQNRAESCRHEAAVPIFP